MPMMASGPRLQPHRTTIAQLAALSGQLALPSDWGIEGAGGCSRLEAARRAWRPSTPTWCSTSLPTPSPDGTQAAEGGHQDRLRGRVRKAEWRFDATLAWPSGALMQSRCSSMPVMDL